MSRVSRRLLPLLLSVIAALAVASIAVPPANAVGPTNATSHTTLTIEAPSAVARGSQLLVRGILRDGAGLPITGGVMTLFLDQALLRAGPSDGDGEITFRIQAAVLGPDPSHTVTIRYEGVSGHAAAAASAAVKVVPLAIRFATVPPEPGVRVRIGTATAITGPDGTAAVPVPARGPYVMSVDVSTAGDEDERVEFSRWLDDVYTPSRTINVHGLDTFAIGLSVSVRANVRFVDLAGEPVDPAIISEARFSTGNGGDDLVLHASNLTDRVWWVTESAVRRAQSLDTSPVTYRLLSVKIAGAQVVNRGQQAWAAKKGGTWTIRVLLYALSVRPVDALFGSPISGKLELVYPDAHSETAALGSAGTASFSNLPRGNYKILIHGNVLAPPAAVALSRPQVVELRIVSYLDIALVLTVLLAALVLLALVGRPHLARRAGRRVKRLAAGAADPSIARRTLEAWLMPGPAVSRGGAPAAGDGEAETSVDPG